MSGIFVISLNKRDLYVGFGNSEAEMNPMQSCFLSPTAPPAWKNFRLVISVYNDIITPSVTKSKR